MCSACVLTRGYFETGGRGVDHVIEVGGAGTIMKAINCTRMAGWIHTIGFVANEKGGDQRSLLVGLLN